MKIYFILILFPFWLSFGCKSAKQHDFAFSDKMIATATIDRLKSDTLLVVLPTNSKKEKILKNLIKKDDNQTENANQKLLNLYAERELRNEALMNAFWNNYDFSDYLFIPDSLLRTFESGVTGVYFLDDDGQIDPTIQYSNSNPVKFIQRSKKEWNVMIGNKLAPNPFPNRFGYKGIMCKPFKGDNSYEDTYDCVVYLLQNDLKQFYKKSKK